LLDCERSPWDNLKILDRLKDSSDKVLLGFGERVEYGRRDNGIYFGPNRESFRLLHLVLYAELNT
jgi:hypothetical protein